jgi:nuclease-like protein
LSAICRFGVGASIATLCCAPMLAAAQDLARAEYGCRFVNIGTATVRATTDEGIALDDGRVAWPAGVIMAKPADIALVAGTPIVLKRVGAAETDRYGRLVAHIFISEGGAERWLQADLVRTGQAQVATRVGDAACARALFGAEQAAREAKLGLWADPYYVMNKAEEPAEVLKARGRLALIEGKVLSVRESGGTIYVNFGRRWTEDFTVTIAKRNERTFTAAGLEPKKLAGRRVRIRGWVEERGGPWVDAARPEQIEVVQ